MQRILSWAVMCALVGGQAYALIAPEYYRKARAEAQYHVQIDITKVEAPRQGPGTCAVEGQVLQIFKDATGKLAKDQIIGFTVACHRQGDTVPVGGTLWLDTDALENADYMEVYLDAAADGFDVAMWNYKLIPKISDTPQLRFD